MEQSWNVINVLFGLISSLRTQWWGRGIANSRLTARLPIIATLAISILFGILPAVLPQSSALAASGYLADEIGNTEITVDVDETFYVVLWLTDVSYLAGYDCAITISGPATAISTAVHGSWFEDNHTVLAGGTPTTTYCSGLLSSPTSISGSGDLVVFTLQGTDDGVVAINVDANEFCLGDTDADEIVITTPSTLYVTVGTGEGYQGSESGNELTLNPASIDIFVNGAWSGTESGTSEEPYNTIQEAINAANEGELIGVAVGEEDDLTYTENLEIGKTVYLRGGLDPSTWEPVSDRASIISAQSDSSPTVEYKTTGTAGSIVSFTITGGKSGVRCSSGTAPTIEDNIITDNDGGTYGGGIYCVGSTNSTSVPMIIGNTITGNSASQGGGIRCYDYWVSSSTSAKIPIVEKNVIISNTASSVGGGIAISHCDGANMRYCIASNIIANNTAGSKGGGIHSWNSKNISIVNDTIVANTVDEDTSALVGGGLWVECSSNNSASAIILNSIIWQNKSYEDEEPKWDEIAVLNGGVSLDVDIDYSDLHGALSHISSGIFTDGDDFNNHHNINADPLLTEDWRLDSESPCIDQGVCQFSPRRAPYDDIDFRARCTGGSSFDIGAHEYGATGTSWPIPGDANLDCRVNILDLIFIRNKLFQSPCDSNNWQADVNNDGLTISVLDLLFTRSLLRTACP
ncbi:MAG TPA: dockerin type I domain-containing protein [Planctomycetota bacterium]|nr:dockerin type I domain-containing protein [Planctomycetota bacterium]